MSATKAGYLMAKMTAKGIDLKAVGGGTVHIDGMHIAAACSGLENLSYLLVLAKYCDDVRAALDAVSLVSREIERRHPFNSLENRECVQRVVATAISEWASGTPCRRCKGRGDLHPTDSPVKPCQDCSGTGQKTPTDQTRSRAARIGTKWWSENKIGDEVMALRDRFSGIENAALWQIYNHAVGAGWTSNTWGSEVRR
jgi:hypothetical protein